MIGVVWFVQIVHYPLFRKVSPRSFPDYEAENTLRMLFLIAVPAGIELLTAASLLFVRLEGITATQAWIGLALLAVIWGSTALYPARLHWLLLKGFDEHLIRQLIATNWVRTIAWTARGILAFQMLKALNSA